MAEEKTLYEINEYYRTLLDSIEVDENGEILNIDEIEAAKAELNDKYEAVAIYIKECKALAEQIKAEEERLKARRERKLKKAEWLSGYLADIMLSNNIKKFETAKCSLSFRASEVVNVTDMSLIPEQYITPKVTLNVDKVGLKKAIKAGELIPGATVERKENIQIK